MSAVKNMRSNKKKQIMKCESNETTTTKKYYTQETINICTCSFKVRNILYIY